MAYQIGFTAEQKKEWETVPEKKVPVPGKSVVQVRFPGKGAPLAYYNDSFDLHPGDRVFVEGKMEGIQGRVMDVSYHFKIKLSEYKRVIAVADTEVTGELFMAGSHFVAFDPAVLPYEKVLSWFKAPAAEEAEYVTGTEGETFSLDDLSGMKITAEVAQRGHDYYLDNRVRYLCISGTHGRAIVEGSRIYEVEFRYREGQISGLICDCPCTYSCKHEFAVMLQLRETLELIRKHYPGMLEESGYFGAVYKPTLYLYAIDGKEKGRLVL